MKYILLIILTTLPISPVFSNYYQKFTTDSNNYKDTFSIGFMHYRVENIENGKKAIYISNLQNNDLFGNESNVLNYLDSNGVDLIELAEPMIVDSIGIPIIFMIKDNVSHVINIFRMEKYRVKSIEKLYFEKVPSNIMLDSEKEMYQLKKIEFLFI